MVVPEDLRPEASRVRRAAAELLPLVFVVQLGQTVLPSSREGSDPPVLGAIALRTSWTQGASATFVVARAGGGVQVLYEAQLVGATEEPDFRFRRLDEPRPLIAEEDDAWRARVTVLERFRDDRCREPLDVVVLPRGGETGPTFDVYPVPVPGALRIVRATVPAVDPETLTERTRIIQWAGWTDLVLGGHHLFRVTGDGRRVLEDRKISGRCSIVTVHPERIQEEVIEVAEPTLDVPNEVQLLMSALSKAVVRVTTRRGTWELARGTLLYVAGPGG
jgi:hypothetical protein